MTTKSPARMAFAEGLMDLALYIHWPFCLSKCPYCDFNSHVRPYVDVEAWKNAFLKDLHYFKSLTPSHRLTSIFFGGGTPSLMPPSLVETLITQALSLWPSLPSLEITLEVNPTSAKKLQEFRAAGVSRLSIGIQSLRDDVLVFLGRQHSAREGRQTIDLAAQIFDRFSFDLIYTRPEQTIDAWEKELKEALAFGAKHLSLYQLTMEPGTPFYQSYQRGDLKMPDEETSAMMYELTQEIMGDMPAYEISNHALPGEESQHNLAYWRYQDYAGIGPGAHSRLTFHQKKHALRQHRAPEMWLKHVEARGTGVTTLTALTKIEELQERVLMGARLAEGIAYDHLPSFWEKVGLEKKQALEESGDLMFDQAHFKLTPQGRQRLNAILPYIFSDSGGI